MPLVSTWRLSNGLSSTDLSSDPIVPLPAEMGQVNIGFHPLGDASGVFDFQGTFSCPVTVTSNTTVNRPILALRLTSSGRTEFRRPTLKTPSEESTQRYSIHLMADAGSLIQHQPGEVNTSLVPIITVDRLRNMMEGVRVPTQIQRFLDGHHENFSITANTSPIMHRLIAQFRSNPYDDGMATIYMQAKVHEMLAEALNDLVGIEGNGGRVMAPDRRRAMEARDLLMADPANPPSMEALARQVGLSQRRLTEVFRDTFGKTAFEWLVDWRLDQARDLLREGALSVKEITFRLGYAHLSNFTKAFTRRFAIAPASYRNAIRSTHAPAVFPHNSFVGSG